MTYKEVERIVQFFSEPKLNDTSNLISDNTIISTNPNLTIETKSPGLQRLMIVGDKSYKQYAVISKLTFLKFGDLAHLMQMVCPFSNIVEPEDELEILIVVGGDVAHTFDNAKLILSPIIENDNVIGSFPYIYLHIPE